MNFTEVNLESMFGIFRPKKYHNISAESASALLSNKNTVFLDVRTPQEKAEGDIKGSKLTNLWGADFTKKVGLLDKDKTYIVFCRSGNRSRTACNIMAKNGFKDLHNLKGGIYAWNRFKSNR